MRERLQILLPSVLALALATLLAMPALTVAQSGLPATISMYPESAGPGATVEVTGLDFPAASAVALQLATPAGTTTLATVAASEGGYFRQLVTLPAEAPAGAWTLEARAADGSRAEFAFGSGAPVTAPPPAAVAVAATEAGGSSSADIMVMLVLAVVLGVVAIAALYTWRSMQAERSQPGMGAGDDLIWSGRCGRIPP